jgi:hypothetical protein
VTISLLTSLARERIMTLRRESSERASLRVPPYVYLKKRIMTICRFTACVGLISSIACGGCSSDKLVTIPVSGRVTFGGGACPAEGTIVFSPVAVEKGLTRRPGTARFPQDGGFTVTSFREGDGLIPGRYRPIINCWKGEPRNEDPSSFDRLNYVPANYKADEIVVTRSDARVEVNVDVPKKK